ncbi:glycosyltransferase [Vicingus serpentipes]|uniref:Glycosyltransferase n=1 Tax=Vicingus serpentipes TaxID=1926625 RepID=A0A5C6RRA6_9FLAO|nr:glycosyltransferase [Vicingus serpentipes]TXB64210.1 glycosyltransferase [Vicingus serpentipes]
MEDLLQEHKIDYSVIIPVYNGEGSIEELCDKLISFFGPLEYTFELIFVDDYSKDGSWAKIINLKKEHALFVKGLRLSKNFGQHIATCAGFIKSSGKFIITIDDDLEVNPQQIQLLIEEQIKSKAEIVYGIYSNIERSLIRKLFKLIYQTIAKIIEGSGSVKGSSFRLINTQLAKKIATEATHLIFIDEVFLWYTNAIVYVDVKHNKSKRSKSNYSLISLIRLTNDVVLYSSLFPLKMIKYFGFFFSFVNFGIGFFYLSRKIIQGIAVPGYTSIIVSILFSSGLIIFILGVLGEYLSKMFQLMNNRPVYSIGEEI